MLFYHIWLYSMITYPPTGEPRWCRKMPTRATFRAFVHLDKFLEAQDCNGRFSKTLVPGNNRKKTITGLSNKHHCQDFVWCLVNTTLRIWPGSKHQKISVRLLLILSSFSLPRGSAGKTNRGDCVWVCNAEERPIKIVWALKVLKVDGHPKVPKIGLKRKFWLAIA